MDPSVTNPISIFLIKKGGGGDRLLFRYPYSVPPRKREDPVKCLAHVALPKRNPYAMTPEMLAEQQHLSSTKPKIKETLNADNLPTFSSKVLSNIFAVHNFLCSSKFELKIEGIRFIGHPLSLEIKPEHRVFFANKKKSPLTMFHVVFALRATSPYSVVECMERLSHIIGLAIRNEERRLGYLTAEAKTMVNAQDEVASMPEESQVSPFELALERSELAQDLKAIFEAVCFNGSCYVRINKYIEVNFCLPQRVFFKLNPCLTVEPDSLIECLEFLKPYHTFLLLLEKQELLRQFPLDGSPTLNKLIKRGDPTLSFRALALETDLPLQHTFQLAGHLLYWGKATVIYPICENNMYVISPKIDNVLTPVVMERFAERFPGEKFVEMLSQFSQPTSIAHQLHLHNPNATQLLGRVIVFFLQQHLIIQLHTYVALCLTDDLTTTIKDPIQEKYGLPWSVARHLGDESKAAGKGGDKHVVDKVPEHNEDTLNTLSAAGSYGSGELDEEFGAMSLERWQWAFDDVPKNNSSGRKPTKKVEEERRRSKTAREDDPNVVLKNFTEEQIAVISNQGGNLDDLKLFAKLAPYFNGRYHVEEILYFANVRRADLMRILDIYSGILCTYDHEDPAVTCYYDMALRDSSKR